MAIDKNLHLAAAFKKIQQVTNNQMIRITGDEDSWWVMKDKHGRPHIGYPIQKWMSIGDDSHLGKFYKSRPVYEQKDQDGYVIGYWQPLIRMNFTPKASGW